MAAVTICSKSCDCDGAVACRLHITARFRGCTTTTCTIAAPNHLFGNPPSTACFGTVQLALFTAAIGIGDGPGDYANFASCTWVVSASSLITVTFSELSTEAGYDFVKLYDGTFDACGYDTEEEAQDEMLYILSLKETV